MLSHNDGSRPPAGPRRTVLVWGALATGGFVAYLLGGGREIERGWHLYLVGLAAIAVVALSNAALRDHRSEETPNIFSWLRARRRRPQVSRLRSLEELERAADFSLATAFDLHYRLRPHLVQIARHRLGARGVKLETQAEAARALLGEPLWDMVRPDRPSPVHRNAKGIAIGDLRDMVEKLETV